MYYLIDIQCEIIQFCRGRFGWDSVGKKSFK